MGLEEWLEKTALERGMSSSPDTRMLGKKAAALFAAGEAPNLTAAVYDVTADQQLNEEQVARIASQANQETWQASLAVGASSFDPADAAQVLGRMRVEPEERDMTYADYGRDVENQSAPSDMDLSEIFGVPRGSPELEALDPTGPARAEVEKVASALQSLESDTDRALTNLSKLGEDLYQMLKVAHVTDGHGILQLGQVLGQAVEDKNFAYDVMSGAVARMAREGVIFNETLEHEKLAQKVVVNPEHPLFKLAGDLETAAYIYYRSGCEHEKLAAVHASASKAYAAQVKARR